MNTVSGLEDLKTNFNRCQFLPIFRGEARRSEVMVARGEARRSEAKRGDSAFEILPRSEAKRGGR